RVAPARGEDGRVMARWCAPRHVSQPSRVPRCGGRSTSSSRFRSTTEDKSEQSQLLRSLSRWTEMVRRQPRARFIEAELLAGQFETAANHPGNRPAAGHARVPARVVVLAAAGLADELEDVPISVRKVGHEPFPE